MKLQLKRDIFEELDWLIDQHQGKGGRDILRIDLDDFEWNQLLYAGHLRAKGRELLDNGTLRIHGYNNGMEVHYRGIEVTKQ